MPVDSLAVGLGVVAVFAIFSFVLLWANRQTNR